MRLALGLRPSASPHQDTLLGFQARFLLAPPPQPSCMAPHSCLVFSPAGSLYCAIFLFSLHFPLLSLKSLGALSLFRIQSIFLLLQLPTAEASSCLSSHPGCEFSFFEVEEMSWPHSVDCMYLLASFPAVWLRLSTAIVVIFFGWVLILNLFNIPDLNLISFVVAYEIPFLPGYKSRVFLYFLRSF